MLNALRLNALRRAVVCTAWACVWLAQARTVLRLLATAQAEQRPDEVWVRGAQLALIAAMVRSSVSGVAAAGSHDSGRGSPSTVSCWRARA